MASAAEHEPSPAKPASKLSGPLVVLLDAFEELPPGTVGYAAALAGTDSPSGAYLTSGIVRVTDTGVQTYIRVAALDDALRAALTSLGVFIERESEDGSTVQAHVPLDALLKVADLAGVLSVTPPVYGFSNALTEGDAILRFDDLRAAQGVDGSGVTVGVISDGIAGLQTAAGTGDLPATSETRVSGTLTATSGGVICTIRSHFLSRFIRNRSSISINCGNPPTSSNRLRRTKIPWSPYAHLQNVTRNALPRSSRR